MVGIYCFGSFNKKDSLAWELADELFIKGVYFKKCSRVEDLLGAKGDIYILDVVKGLKQVTIIDDVEKLETGDLVSLHDFDVGFFIKFLKGLRAVNAKVIGIPYGSKKQKVIKEVETVISDLVKK